MFLKTAGDGLLVRVGVGGTSTPLCIVFMDSGIWISPPKNPPSKNLRLLNFANLTLHAREARGVPQPHWFSLSRAKENQSETDLVSCLVSIYDSARTYFSTNAD